MVVCFVDDFKKRFQNIFYVKMEVVIKLKDDDTNIGTLSKHFCNTLECCEYGTYQVCFPGM